MLVRLVWKVFHDCRLLVDLIQDIVDGEVGSVGNGYRHDVALEEDGLLASQDLAKELACGEVLWR